MTLTRVNRLAAGQHGIEAERVAAVLANFAGPACILWTPILP